MSERQHRGVGAGALNRQIAAASSSHPPSGTLALGVDPADPAAHVPADHNVTPAFTAPVVNATPLHETPIGALERLEPRLGFVEVQDDVELIPCGLDEAAGPLAVDRTEIHALRAFPLLIRHVGGIFSGHS